MEPIISNNNFIAKDSNIKIIDEVSIDGRYKARNHLSKMRKNSINNFSRLDIDTLIIYYRFYANINIANTYQQEKFQGILKVSYNSFNQSLDVLNANFCQIELFENNIEDRTYERTRPNFFHQLLRRNIMVDNNKDWRHVVSRRNTIENIFNANDSTFFRSFRVQNNEETLFFYLGFAENKIKFFISDWTTDRNNSKQVPFNPYGVYRQHLMINYCNNFHILPHTLTYKESTILDGESDVEYFIKFEQIEKPKDIKIDCIFPLRVSERNEQVVERVRKNDDG
ncbi:MAG: hypothetical protein GX879_07060 [Bacteroidales bacterium]|nr:hypothetical protein [Bacteroidales bacterium]